ncbi:hypothetical protein AC249_AIPGENE7717 [Exaiptasia diaphana]|nr:hypothetical protein AC249_AIPGENE7717 [Exaiptasia diaphana]
MHLFWVSNPNRRGIKVQGKFTAGRLFNSRSDQDPDETPGVTYRFFVRSYIKNTSKRDSRNILTRIAPTREGPLNYNAKGWGIHFWKTSPTQST